MNRIDYLIEKFLVGFKGSWGDYVEVFENPSKSEVKEIGNAVRWILDAKHKKAYAFNGLDCLHLQAWKQIKKEINDNRDIYHTSELLPVDTFSNKTEITVMFKDSYDPKVDWSWAKKYVPKIDQALKDLEEYMESHE